MLAGLFGGGVKSMNQDNIVLDIHNLSKSVKKKDLLKPLNYKLSKGKILALCGGNGAGKSTLIRLLTGILTPTTGRITLNGKDYKNEKQLYLKQFGYMPDDFHFHQSMTTKETIAFYAQLNNISKVRYEEVLHDVGLIEHLNEKVKHFSKGMNQRLLLAQALLAKPSTLILDEPTNGLDPYWIKQFCKLMLQAKMNGQTIIFSTHDLHIAEQIADEVIFLSHGEVISKGTMSNYYEIGLYETFQQLYFESLSKNKR